MGEKNQKNNGGEQKNESENKKKENEEGKNRVTVVLKTDLHCEGCTSKVIKCIRSFDGVDTATVADGQKITVVGNVDPVKLRERVEQKTHKKVELISPLPKKLDNNGNNKENAKGKDSNGGDSNNPKQEKKKESEDKIAKDKSDEKKSKEKEPPVTTAVFKVHLHCEGCIQKIYRTVTKIKGYEELKIDKQKDLVTVTGAMDMNALVEVLKKQLKKDVQIVPPKKEGEKKDDTGGDKGKVAGGGGGKAAGEGGGELEGNRLQFQGGYPYPFVYSTGLVGDPTHHNWDGIGTGTYHAPQMFSDENPHACSVM